MNRLHISAALLVSAAASAAMAQESPIQIGDLALGLNVSSAANTTRQVRGGVSVGRWTSLPWVEAAEFDNCDGPFSHSGNLLGLNFGTTSTGGSLQSMSTNGSNAGQIIYQFNAGMGAIATTRIGGLSVSPDNTRIAVLGYDTASVYVLDYTAAPCGSGVGASVSNPRASAGLGNTGDTQGTAWLDDDTVIAYSIAGQPIGSALWSMSAADPSNPTLELFVEVPGNGSGFSDIEYNPCLSPYIYLMYSDFTSNVSENRLTVIDPRGGTGAWIQVAQISLSGSLNTAREIALGRDLNLYIGQFAGSGLSTRIYVDRLNLDVNNDGVVDAADTAALTDNSSVDFYSESPGTSASFNGLDIVVGTLDCGPAPIVGACCIADTCVADLTRADCEKQGGTYNGDDSVCGADTCRPACPCDWNTSGAVNSQDFFDFLAGFFQDNADFNDDMQTNSQDFFDFLACFFNPPAGC